MRRLSAVAELEAAGLEAWPALTTHADRSWLARFSDGYTKRGNSINVRDPEDTADAARRIAALAELYVARGLPPTFRVTPLTGATVIDALDEAAWTKFSPSLVMAVDLAVVASPRSRFRLLNPASDEWLSAQLALSDGEGAATLAKIIGRIADPRTGVVALDDEGLPVSAALCSIAGGVAMLLCVVTAQDRRRRGFGGTVMRAAMTWARARGCSRAALAVLADNASALALYAGLGFAPVYDYHYRRPEMA